MRAPPHETGRKSPQTQRGEWACVHARGRVWVFFTSSRSPGLARSFLCARPPLHAPSPPAAVRFPMRRYGALITAVARETEGTGFSHAVRWL